MDKANAVIKEEMLKAGAKITKKAKKEKRQVPRGLKEITIKKRKQRNIISKAATEEAREKAREELAKLADEEQSVMEKLEHEKIEKLIADTPKNERNLYKFIKKYKRKGEENAPIENAKGNLCFTKKEKAEILADYYEKSQPATNEKYFQEIEEICDTKDIEDQEWITSYEFTKEEIVATIKEMKPHKTAGPDGWEIDTIKIIAEEIAEAYKIVYNQAITTRQPLEEIYSSHVKPIHKGGLKTKAANYRQVSMLSVATKIYDKIIKLRA